MGVCSRAIRIVRIAVRCARRYNAIARPADGAIVRPESHHCRCVDAVGQWTWASGAVVERRGGAADAAVDCAGALLVVGFPVLLRKEVKVSLVLGNGSKAEQDV